MIAARANVRGIIDDRFLIYAHDIVVRRAEDRVQERMQRFAEQTRRQRS